MNEKIFVIGGARSGKSSHALKLAGDFDGSNKVFVATCVPCDEEMKKRVKRHQKERGEDWNTVEISVQLPDTILKYSKEADLILVDCLTLWVSNLLQKRCSVDFVTEYAKQMAEAVKESICPVIMVSNEVGTGIVPENRLARLFRDAAGFVSQAAAKICDRVIWMTAGIPVKIKG